MKTALPFLAKAILLIFLLGTFPSCEKESVTSESSDILNASVKSLNTVEITSTGMNFFAPDEIPSGWNTFEYTNGTSVPHFFLLVKVPLDKSLEEYHSEITVPFNNILKLMRGENPDGPATLPLWFSEVKNFGGSGLIDPGKTAVTSVNLEPGNYMIECYVKMPNGDFHSFPENGMLKQLTVTEEDSKGKEPKADVSIDVTAGGYVLDHEISRPGMHTFAVEYEGGDLTADVHLVRFDGATEEDLQELNFWMHWANISEEAEGLMTPAPAGFTFLGGAQELEKGGTTYFQALLKPGTYALIAEWPDSMADNFYYEFTVGGKKK